MNKKKIIMGVCILVALLVLAGCGFVYAKAQMVDSAESETINWVPIEPTVTELATAEVATVIDSVKPEANIPPAKKIVVYFFTSPTCTYCADEQVLLETISEKYSPGRVEIKQLSIKDYENSCLLLEMMQQHNLPPTNKVVPMTFVGEKSVVGYQPRVIKTVIEEEINSP